jgi:hypothetical protein
MYGTIITVEASGRGEFMGGHGTIAGGRKDGLGGSRPFPPLSREVKSQCGESRKGAGSLPELTTA